MDDEVLDPGEADELAAWWQQAFEALAHQEA